MLSPVIFQPESPFYFYPAIKWSYPINYGTRKIQLRQQNCQSLYYRHSCFWLVGMLVGLTAAIQLVYPIFNFDSQYTTFGRIRPLHTNAIIFAFVGNAMFAGVYYSMQRLLKTRMYQRYVELDTFLGMAVDHSRRSHYASAWNDNVKGIRRT